MNQVKNKLRVVFLGNHNVGIKAIEAILENATLVGVVCHPKDDEEGVVYDSVFDFVTAKNIPTIRGKGNDEKVYDFISSKNADLIWITDYKFIIPKKIMDSVPLGAINLHPSLLPKYRGRAPINWAIINGETKTGLTAHFVEQGIDTGNIIEQIEVSISENEYIGDILDKLYPIYFSITQQTLKKLQENKIVATAQPNLDKNPIYPRRTAKDGEINWDNLAKDIYNLIRAVSKPYPGAFTFIENEKIVIWKAQLLPLEENDEFLENGKVVEEQQNNNSFTLKCNDARLKIKEYSTEYKGKFIEKKVGKNYVQKNISFYSDLIEKHGIDVKSLNWGSKQSQELRFKILSQLTDLNNKSVLDIGCGLGDFYNYLDENNIKVNYKGIDITPKMIEKAKERFINVDFEIMNILTENLSTKVDCIFASGIFAYQNQSFLEEFIQKSFKNINHSLAFNSLSSLANDKEEGEFYANPFETLAFCQKITPWVTLRQDYHSRDFTIYMYKERNT